MKKVPMCNISGLNCFSGIPVLRNDCLSKCKGLYVDVNRKSSYENIIGINRMGKMSAKYEEYKRGFHKDIERVYGSYKMTGTFYSDTFNHLDHVY